MPTASIGGATSRRVRIEGIRHSPSGGEPRAETVTISAAGGLKLLPFTGAGADGLRKSVLEKKFNAAVNVTVEVNPALIAGVVIRAGDQVIDDSALNKLEKMRTRLLA